MAIQAGHYGQLSYRRLCGKMKLEDLDFNYKGGLQLVPGPGCQEAQALHQSEAHAAPLHQPTRLGVERSCEGRGRRAYEVAEVLAIHPAGKAT